MSSGNNSGSSTAAAAAAAHASVVGGVPGGTSSSSSNNNPGSTGGGGRPAEKPLWDLDLPAVFAWLSSLDCLSSASLQQRIAQPAAEGQKTKQAANNNNNNSNVAPTVRSVRHWLYSSLRSSLQGLQLEIREEDVILERVDRQHRSKKQRTKKNTYLLHDPYHIFLHAVAAKTAASDDPNGNSNNDNNKRQESFFLDDQSDVDVPTTAGGKLAQLTIGGLLNSLAGKVGGIVQKVTPSDKLIQSIPEDLLSNNSSSSSAGNDHTGTAATATALPVPVLYQIVLLVHSSISRRVRMDILTTTPTRIQNLLAPDLQPHEFAAVRKRIYDTVILGKGLHLGEQEMDEEELALPTGGMAAMHDIEKMKKCANCGNNDQSLFVLDRKNGDVICSLCGTVNSESIMHEGSQFRKFEGEVDRNHHGDAGNPLFSNAHNMSTSLTGVVSATGAGLAGWGSSDAGGGGGKMGGRRQNLETILRNAHAYTELNVSQFGKNDRRTRTGYKDRQKKDAFIQMGHVGDSLSLHEAVVQRAKEIFAGFRDDRELVQQFKAVIAACLCESFEQLSQQGRAILKQEQNQENAEKRERAAEEAASEADKIKLSKRAARRNELHNATLAGKGGLLLDFSNIKEESKQSQDSSVGGAVGNTSPKSSPTTPTGDSSSTLVSKPASSWDLEDCRRWLLDASQSIANQWVEEREQSAGSGKLGSREELEGQLVNHAITLCEHLEKELKDRQKKKGRLAPGGASRKANSQRVITPRVRDMSNLGIKWQHAHERGSGGKGGVGASGKGSGGSSGNAVSNRKRKHPGASTLAAGPGNRTGGDGLMAGQVLHLITAKKLGTILEDEVAGKAIHKELRSVINQQQERKRLLLRQEATRQRLQQMKRKPWLVASATQAPTA